MFFLGNKVDMSNGPIKFVSATEDQDFANFASVTYDSRILMDIKPWVSIKEKELVKETDVENFISEYHQYAIDLATFCDDPECARLMLNPIQWITENGVHCSKRHTGDESARVVEDRERSEQNTQKWIWENTQPFLGKKFPVNDKPPLSEEEKERQKKMLGLMLQDRKKDIEASDEHSPWFSPMHTCDTIERDIFDPLRKPGIRLKDEKYPENFLMKKVNELVHDRREEEEKIGKERRETDKEIEKALSEHKIFFYVVLEELLETSFVFVGKDDVEKDDVEKDDVDTNE